MLVNTEMIMKWGDYHMGWNPEDFEGIKYLRMPFYDIWFPDIILYNT